MIKFPDLFKNRRMGLWTLAGLLLIFYFVLKMQGWAVAGRVAELEKQMVALRPKVAAILQGGQIGTNRNMLSDATKQIEQNDVHGQAFLQMLSKNVPVTVTMQRAELRGDSLWIRGTCLAGVRSPQEVLNPLLSALSAAGHSMKLIKVEEDPQTPGLWSFEMSAGGGA